MNHSLEPLYSQLSDDPVISEILPLFIRNLSGYVKGLEEAFASRDWDMARRKCHDLKGTAGGYGFPSISEAAAKLESALKLDESLDRLEMLLDVVRVLCHRAELALISNS